METSFDFWENASCEDCPVTHNEWREGNTELCPFNSNLYKYMEKHKVLECPYLNKNLKNELNELVSSTRGFMSKKESFDATALDLKYEDMFVSGSKAFMWLVTALKFKQENELLKKELEKLK